MVFETKLANSAENRSVGTLATHPSSLVSVSVLIRYRRLENNVGRRDFLTNVADKVKTGEVSHEEMAAHSSTLV